MSLLSPCWKERVFFMLCCIAYEFLGDFFCLQLPSCLTSARITDACQHHPTSLLGFQGSGSPAREPSALAQQTIDSSVLWHFDLYDSICFSDTWLFFICHFKRFTNSRFYTSVYQIHFHNRNFPGFV